MIIEIGSICAIVKGCSQLVLIGDEKQLPPIVLSPVDAWWGMGISLYERIENSLYLWPAMLNLQYRMHPSMAEYPSLAFYNNSLFSEEETILNRQPTGFPWPNKEYNICFINVEGGTEERALGETSYYNTEEIALMSVASFLLLKSGGLYMGGDDIGIIAGYSAQRALLKEALGMIDREEEKLGGWTQGEYASHSQIEVNTIDGFQGREKNVVILGTTRTNHPVYIYIFYIIIII